MSVEKKASNFVTCDKEPQDTAPKYFYASVVMLADDIKQKTKSQTDICPFDMIVRDAIEYTLLVEYRKRKNDIELKKIQKICNKLSKL